MQTWVIAQMDWLTLQTALNARTNKTEMMEEEPYTDQVSFWRRLKMFVEDVKVNDPMSEEEKGMILNMCDYHISQHEQTKLK